MQEQVRLKNDPTLVGTKADPQYIKALSVLREHIIPISKDFILLNTSSI